MKKNNSTKKPLPDYRQKIQEAYELGYSEGYQRGITDGKKRQKRIADNFIKRIQELRE